MSSLESGIDALYKGLLDDFVASRTALARTVAGDDAKRVKALVKPTVVPWAVNQVYWHARSVFDRLLASGHELRDAQLALLAGRTVDIRRASDSHRAELAKVIGEAMRQAAAVSLKPDLDALTQTIEAVSMAPDTSEMDGRLTKPLRPAGFEALANAVVKPRAHGDVPFNRTHGQPDARKLRQRGEREREKEQERAKQEALAARRRAAAVEKARLALDKAVEAEEHARAEFEERRRDRQEKERTLAQIEAE